MFRLRRSKTYVVRPKRPKLIPEMHDRQDKVDGSSFEAFQAACIGVIGGGGLGGNFIHGVVRNGAGDIAVFDDDTVEPSNQNRQPFSFNDLGRYKVHALGRALRRQGFFPAKITAHPFRFQEIHPPHQKELLDHYDAVVCGPDNNPTRKAAAAFGHHFGIPVIFGALARDASAASVFVQDVGQACWGCAYPEYVNDSSYPCGVGSSNCIVSVAVGLMLAAADTIIGNRYREWNRRDVYLHGSLPDQTRTIKPRPDCPICSAPSSAQSSQMRNPGLPTAA